MLLLTVKDLAKRLCLPRKSAYLLVATKQIRHVRIGAGRGTIRIPEEAIAEYLAAATAEARGEGGVSPSSPPPPGRTGEDGFLAYYRRIMDEVERKRRR